MGTCAFTGNWACDEIFFKNLCFHSPTQAQENIVCKISTLEGVFLKDAFLETVYTGNVRMVGQTGEKNFHFQTETDTCRRWDVKKRQLNGHKTNLHCGYKSWKKKDCWSVKTARLQEDVTKTGNGERRTGNGERKSGNELSAETSIKIQYGRWSMIENRRNKLNR